LGKKRRDEYWAENRINLGNFLLFEHPIKANGIKAIPRKNTTDYNVLFWGDREESIQPHLTMNEGETFIDAGSHVGFYALKAATDYGNNIKVIAIEAHPDNYKALNRNIACNGFTNVTTINKAISDKKGTVTLYQHITEDNHLSRDDFSICREFGKGSTIKVESDNLDNILREYNNTKNIKVIKMDIEGAEVLALRGATETLKTTRKIVVEIHGENIGEVKAILQENDFDIQTAEDITPTWTYPYVIGDNRRFQPSTTMNKEIKSSITE
jgi:FkbM family methyltransferase